MASGERSRAVLWAAVVAALAIVLGRQVRHGFPLETNILKLLPPSEQDPVVQEAIEQYSGRMTGTVAILLGHADPDVLAEATALLIAELDSSGLFSSVGAGISDSAERAWFDLYFPRRYQLLTPRVRAILGHSGSAGELVHLSERALHGPMPAFYGKALARDPLQLFRDYAAGSAATAGTVSVEGGALITRGDDTVFALVPAVAAGDPLAREVQKRVLTTVERVLARLRTVNQGLSAQHTGYMRFAADAYRRASLETTAIGTVSFAGIILLFLLTFGSLRQLLLGSVPIAVGMVAALAVSLVLFPRLHAITLTMGAALIGVCVDYSLHYFAHQRLDRERERGVISAILPGITLGALTSAMGYAGFFVSPFPGLKQIALFSCTGLAAAYATVVCWYPVLAGGRLSDTRPSMVLRSAGVMAALWHKLPPRATIVLLLAAAVLAGIGLAGVRFDDDVRSLGYTDPSIDNEDRAVRAHTGNLDGSRFVVVRGLSDQEVLERQEALGVRLQQLVAEGHLSSYRSLAQFVPSASRQQTDHSLLARALQADETTVRARLEGIGFARTDIDSLFAVLSRPPDSILTVEAWLSSPASDQLRHLWVGNVHGEKAALVLLGVTGNTALARAACALPGVHYVDTVEGISHVLARYRRQALALVGLAYLAILVVLMARYGARGGFVIMLPPVVGSGLAVSALALSGHALNILHVLALLLVLGIGVDYTIFFAEGQRNREATMLAVFLSGITTFLSFGLLFLSRTPALKGLGLVVAPSIVVCLFLSPSVGVLLPWTGGQAPRPGGAKPNRVHRCILTPPDSKPPVGGEARGQKPEASPPP